VAIVSNLITGGDPGQFTCSWQYDDATNMVTGVTWDNPEAQAWAISFVLYPGVLGSNIGADVTALELSAPAACPLPAGAPLVIQDPPGNNLVQLVVASAVAVGDPSVPVQADPIIPTGSQPRVSLPIINVPPSGETAPLDPLFGGGTVGSTAGADLSSLGIPTQTSTGLHGRVTVGFPGAVDTYSTS
jgi:hypothetical protein